MAYQVQITLTRQDYLEYNYFHNLRSESGRKSLRNSRILLCIFLALLGIVILINTGLSTVSLLLMVFLSVFLLGYAVGLERIVKKNIAAQVSRMEKNGKLPFSPVSTLVFAENKITETREGRRTELWYSILERVCIYEDTYLYLYESSVGALILPVSQLKAQVDYPAFLLFLEQKCCKIEHYSANKRRG